MATILFFGKPGCAGNAREQARLEAAGHAVLRRDLLTHPWTAGELQPFLAGRPVAEWFNTRSPRVKSGEVDPDAFDEAGALAALLADPLLIRRPLLQIGDLRGAGLDDPGLAALLAVDGAPVPCDRERPCPPPPDGERPRGG